MNRNDDSIAVELEVPQRRPALFFPRFSHNLSATLVWKRMERSSVMYRFLGKYSTACYRRLYQVFANIIKTKVARVATLSARSMATSVT